MRVDAARNAMEWSGAERSRGGEGGERRCEATAASYANRTKDGEPATAKATATATATATGTRMRAAGAATEDQRSRVESSRECLRRN